MKQTNEIIKALREDHDKNQTEIATVLGITQQYYSHYEQGNYEVPVRHLLTLSKYYNVSMDYLTGASSFSPRLDEMQGQFSKTLTAGQFLSAAMALGPVQRESLQEYVEFLLSRE